MEEQLIELLRDRFDKLEAQLLISNQEIRDHIEVDRRYWTKIDQQEAQISLIKWIGSSISVSGLLAWLFSKFGHH